jgi:hypothetical protein
VECSYLTNSQTTVLFTQILFYAAIASDFQVSFEVKGVNMGSTELPLNLIEICDDNGNRVLSVFMSSSRAVIVDYMHNQLTEANSGPEIISNYIAEWTTVAVSLHNGLLSFWTVADVESAMYQYDVSAIFGWLACAQCQFYASGQSDVGASGYIRNIRISGMNFSFPSCFCTCIEMVAG